MQYMNFDQEELAVMAELDDEEIAPVVGGLLGILDGVFGGTEALEPAEPAEAPEAPEASGTTTNSNNDIDGNNDVNVTQNFSILNLFQGSNISPSLSLLGGSATGGSNSNITNTTYNISNTR
jgi:hypothetical protein